MTENAALVPDDQPEVFEADDHVANDEDGFLEELNQTVQNQDVEE
jgi:hypothetical protein